MNIPAIFGGSFDPIHLGHLDIIRRGSLLFQPILVAVGHNPAKKTLFDIETRLEMVTESVQGIEGVQVEAFEGLLVEHARSRGCQVHLRGLRTSGDFLYESPMAVANRQMLEGFETVCLVAAPEHGFFSSSLIREIVGAGGDVSGYVPLPVLQRFRRQQS